MIAAIDKVGDGHVEKMKFHKQQEWHKVLKYKMRPNLCDRSTIISVTANSVCDKHP